MQGPLEMPVQVDTGPHPEKHLRGDWLPTLHVPNASFRNSANRPRDEPPPYVVLGVGDREVKKYELCSLFRSWPLERICAALPGRPKKGFQAEEGNPGRQ